MFRVRVVAALARCCAASAWLRARSKKYGTFAQIQRCGRSLHPLTKSAATRVWHERSRLKKMSILPIRITSSALSVRVILEKLKHDGPSGRLRAHPAHPSREVPPLRPAANRFSREGLLDGVVEPRQNHSVHAVTKFFVSNASASRQQCDAGKCAGP